MSNSFDLLGIPKRNDPSSARSEIRCIVGVAYGSTNNMVRRWTAPQVAVGGDITFVDSAVLGTKFVINANGIYSISYSDGTSVGPTRMAIVVNGTQPTTGVQSILDFTIKAAGATIAANYRGNVSWTGYLFAGDYIWAQTDGTTMTDTASQNMFEIIKVTN